MVSSSERETVARATTTTTSVDRQHQHALRFYIKGADSGAK